MYNEEATLFLLPYPQELKEFFTSLPAIGTEISPEAVREAIMFFEMRPICC